MSKIIAMIPARIGSQRIPMKNIRLLNNKPLISFIIEAAIKSNVFTDIYINSENGIFLKIARDYKCKFYQRPIELASNTATNDQFAADFIENVPCDILVQLLPTSPFITPEEIKKFVGVMVDKKYETLISVNRIQIECIYKDKPINYIKTEQTQPSQTLTPIFSYACGIMGWNTTSFKNNMLSYNSAYHGGIGKTGYFELSGYSTVDVDNESDFQLAEAIAQNTNSIPKPATYYKSNDRSEHSEVDVPSILKKDGVIFIEQLDEYIGSLSNISEIINKMPKDISWSKRLVNSENNSATLISQLPGEGNRLHYHSDWNEWWYIVDGEWEWMIEGKVIHVKKDDVVFIDKGKLHKITAIGNKPAIRLAVSREDVAHIYPFD